MKTRAVQCLVIVLCLFQLAAGQTPPAAVDRSDPVYAELRKLAFGNESLAVNNVSFKRDAGLFTLSSGVICFVTPVQGKITGAVFVGTGSFALTPPVDVEKRHLSLLTGNQPLREEFSELVLRFTDDTYDVLKKAQGVSAGRGSCPAAVLADNASALQHKLHYNLSGRILQDLLSDAPGGLFIAFIKGKQYSDKLLYVVDDHGVPTLPGQIFEPGPEAMPPMQLAPEEVMLMTWDPNNFGVWAAFHRAREYAAGTPSSSEQNSWLDIEKQELDVAFDRGGSMDAKATTTFSARAAGLRVVPFDLFPTLRVKKVTDAAGQPLSFIQESKEDDPQFFVILPKALAAGEKCVLTTTYSGKDAVRAEGVGNYYPIARDNWYPNSGRFDDYALYDMRFAVPKGMIMVATGTPVTETVEGDQAISRWTSEQPLTVAGFQFGRVKKLSATLGKGLTIEAYANTEAPDFVRDFQARISMDRIGRTGSQTNLTMGSFDLMDTTGMMQSALADAREALPLYMDFFGPVPMKRLAMTQQTATNYGQAWPGLVWLPISYFWGESIRRQLGMIDTRGYFTVVGPHEIAHQWWGHAVTWPSYRDQWMSEGFAEFSASLYLQRYKKDPMAWVKFWNSELELLLEKNRYGYRPVEFAPLTLGIRSITTKSGEEDIYNRLIYIKGGYVLHMIRMMMIDQKTGDQRFREMMRDFVKTYNGKPATTEDFKAIVEKHMAPAMNLAGDGRMDWFFNEYVYGTALPHYRLEYSFGKDDKGQPVLDFRLTQSNVTDDFGMVVPLYLEVDKNNIVKLGSANMIGNNTITKQLPLAGFTKPPKRLLVAYYDDVLGIIENPSNPK